MTRVALIIALVLIIVISATGVRGQPATPTSPSATPEPSPTTTPWVWWDKNPDALSITLSTDKTRYKLGDDILVKIQETNTSTDAIEFWNPRAYIDYDLYMSDGFSLIKPLSGDQRNGCPVVSSGRPYGSVIAPQATARESGCKGDYTAIADWGLKVSKPGTYYLVAISVYMEIHSNNQQYSIKNQLSNIAAITVTR